MSVEVESLRYSLKLAEESMGKRIKELEAMLRPGVSDMLNRLAAADLAEVSPITGEIRFTTEGEAVVRSRTRLPAVDANQ